MNHRADDFSDPHAVELFVGEGSLNGEPGSGSDSYDVAFEIRWQLTGDTKIGILAAASPGKLLNRYFRFDGRTRCGLRVEIDRAKVDGMRTSTPTGRPAPLTRLVTGSAVRFSSPYTVPTDEHQAVVSEWRLCESSLWDLLTPIHRAWDTDALIELGLSTQQIIDGVGSSHEQGARSWLVGKTVFNAYRNESDFKGDRSETGRESWTRIRTAMMSAKTVFSASNEDWRDIVARHQRLFEEMQSCLSFLCQRWVDCIERVDSLVTDNSRQDFVSRVVFPRVPSQQRGGPHHALRVSKFLERLPDLRQNYLAHRDELTRLIDCYIMSFELRYAIPTLIILTTALESLASLVLGMKNEPVLSKRTRAAVRKSIREAVEACEPGAREMISDDDIAGAVAGLARRPLRHRLRMMCQTLQIKMENDRHVFGFIDYRNSAVHAAAVHRGDWDGVAQSIDECRVLLREGLLAFLTR